jgi:hypothetical protein
MAARRLAEIAFIADCVSGENLRLASIKSRFTTGVTSVKRLKRTPAHLILALVRAASPAGRQRGAFPTPPQVQP